MTALERWTIQSSGDNVAAVVKKLDLKSVILMGTRWRVVISGKRCDSRPFVDASDRTSRIALSTVAKELPYPKYSYSFNKLLRYNKAVYKSGHGLAAHCIEPELIVSQAFAKCAGGYLHCDTHYDFNARKYAQTLEAGLEFELYHEEKWGLSPYFQFPLSHSPGSPCLRTE